MDSKFRQKNIFESGFDSFEFDDGFLLKVDADLKKNAINKKDTSSCKNIKSNKVEKSCLKSKENNENIDRKLKYCDAPLFIEDLNESDFFDFSKTKTAKTKVNNNCKDIKEKNQSSKNVFTNCVSPVLTCKSFNKSIISSSTPLKSINDLASDKVEKTNEKQNNETTKNSQFDYLEADLFDDWNLDEIKKPSAERETVTLSQALKLIEEAKAAREIESEDTKPLNDSIDLLTGEIVCADVKNLFAQSFDLLNSVEKKHDSKKKDSSDESVVVIEDNVKCKPSAAQKLNFGCENICSNATKKKNVFQSICFSSDDDFDLFTQDFPGKGKKKQKCAKSESGVTNLMDENTKSDKAVKNYDSSESYEDIVNLKKRKNLNVIVSDSSEENSSPEFHRKKKSRRRRNFQDDSRKEFFEFEAEVSEDGEEVSSDEVEEEGEYERSFVDEESYLSQNCSADMTAKYLQSVKGLNRPGTFKIPEAKPYIPENVFSQIPEGNNTDYQIDSFCVNDVEEDVKTDLSDLEIAEKILEMDQKKRKKRSYKSKKIR